MAYPEQRLDATYLNRQRIRLIQLRDALCSTSNATEAAEADLRGDANVQAREYEDEAQRLDALENAGVLVARDVDRLARVERALEKIADGSYGLSDLSGERIPDSRLEALPDAIDTVGEQEAREQAASPQ
jgi:DnaK suppressor protein